MSKPQYIKAGWLIDGSGGPVRKNTLITVTNGIITALDTVVEGELPEPESVTDLSSCTVLPPFVDCHVHLSMSGCTDLQAREQHRGADFQTIAATIAEHLHHHFTHGVLAVRDGGDKFGHAMRYKIKSVPGGKEPVMLKVAGRAWHKKGRYGGFIGRCPRENETLAEAIVRENPPIDHLKLINSGLNSLCVFAKETPPQFTLDELKAFVHQARKRGKKIMVHANGELPVRRALEAGCDSIEHGFFMGRDNLKRMADTQTIWVPTVCTMKAFTRQLDLRDPGIDRGVVEKNLHHQLEQMALAKQYGVHLALGTDAGCKGVHHGKSVVDELKLIKSSGYSVTEAIQCATSTGARLLEIDETGNIAKGKPANFLAVRAAPAMLPGKLSCLEGIYLGGRLQHSALVEKCSAAG